jgi:hypothetical protein
VFTQNGQVAQEGETLPDGSTLDQIDDQGKVAINNFDWLAFHGQIEIAGGLEKRRAVFTSDGQTTQVAVKVGDTLPDETPLDDITESGGVAINDFDEVAFHGRVVDPDAPADTLKAVFTADGLAAREGSALEDETLLDDINEDGGVAINVFGDVAFHGQTGGVKAVFTQNGLVAKVGDTLDDGTTTLTEISDKAGVAINPFGREVAFHGRTGGVKAVFVGR